MRFSRFAFCALLLGVSTCCLGLSLPLVFTPQDVYRYNDLPEQVGKLYLPVGHPGLIHFRPQSPWKDVQAVRLRVQVPEAIHVKLYGCRAFWRGTYLAKTLTETVSQGMRTVEYELNPQTFKTRTDDHVLYFLGDFRSAKGSQAVLTLVGDGQVGATHAFDIVPVELPKIRRPKSYRMFAYSAMGAELPDVELSEKNAVYYEQLGLNALLMLRNRGSEKHMPSYRMLERRGWWLGTSCGWLPGFDLKPSEDNLCRDSKGKPNPETREQDWWVRYCPQFLTEECLKRQNTKELKTDGLKCDGLYLDIELYCQKLPLLEICRCPRCLKAFSAYSGIPLDKFTREDVSKKYHAQWLEFRKKQQGDLVGAFIGMYKAPKVEFCFNSLFEYPDSNNDFSLIRNYYYESFSTYIMPMVYVRGPKIFDIFKHNVASTKAEFVPMIYSTALSWLPDWNTPAEYGLDMVASAACGATGIAYFCHADFDGLYALEIMKALDAIAVCEEFNRDRFNQCNEDVRILNDFPKQQLEVDGKAVDVAAIPIDGMRHLARRKDGTTLIQLFNYGAGLAKIRLAMPKVAKGNYLLEDPVNGARYMMRDTVQSLSAEQLQKGIPLTLKPFSYLILTVKEAPSVLPACTRTRLVKERPVSQQSEVRERRLERDGMVICRTDRTGKGQYDVLMESPELSMWIDLSDNGQVVRLLHRKLKRDYCREPGIGLMREKFDIPNADKIGAPYKVISRRIADGRAELVLEARPVHGVLKDFIIRKTYVLHGDRPSFDVSYMIEVQRNIKEQADFRMRVQNRPAFGLKGDNLEDAIAFVCQVGGKELSETGNAHVGFGTKEGLFKGYLSRTLKGVFDKPEFWLRTKVGCMRFSCTAEAPVTQFFSWRSGVPTGEIFFRASDFPYDPHQTKVWRAGISCEVK